MSKDKGQPSNVLLLRMQKIKQKIWKGLKKWQLGNTMHLETCLVSLDTHPLADKQWKQWKSSQINTRSHHKKKRKNIIDKLTRDQVIK